MSSTNKRRRKAEKLTQKYDIYFLIPLVLILSIVPTIVLMKPIQLKGISAETWISPQSVDFFSYYKSVIFIVFSSLLLITFVFRVGMQGLETKKSIYYYPLGIYALVVIVSLIAAKYPDVALFGYVERYEGTLVLLGYIIVMVVGMNLAKGERTIKILVASILISAAIIALIGVFQLIGWDFYKSVLGKQLIVPSLYAHIRDQLNFTFPKHQVYTSVYNPNYVGSYVALILPVLVGLTLYFKNIFQKIGLFLFSCCLIVSLIGSGSKTGMGISVVAFILLIVFLRKPIISNYKFIGVMVIASIVLSVGANIVSNGFLYYKLSSVGESIIESVRIAKKDSSVKKKLDRLQAVFTDRDEMKIKTEKAILILKNVKSQIIFLDGNKNSLDTITDDGGSIGFRNETYSDIKVTVRNNGGNSTVYVSGKEILFFLTKEGFKVPSVQNRLIDAGNPPKWGFVGIEDFASGRGFIWSRTLPMLRDTIIFGHGADTFAIFFPQDDIAGKLLGLDSSIIVVDKPHNMYLQMAVNTGVVSVLAFLFIIFAYTVSSIRIYIKARLDSFLGIIGVSVFIGVLSYCLTGIFNDSTISVAPVFWTMLGIGISINGIIKKQIA
ncbi:MAG: O-antigen ligase family protein [Clostridia bacterium]|nr:O-antigen ligase family protein [Clostridia bacterium]